jgi:hypothetical protein
MSGKGDKWRSGTDFKKYRENKDFWKNLENAKKQREADRKNEV